MIGGDLTVMSVGAEAHRGPVASHAQSEEGNAPVVQSRWRNTSPTGGYRVAKLAVLFAHPAERPLAAAIPANGKLKILYLGTESRRPVSPAVGKFDAG